MNASRTRVSVWVVVGPLATVLAAAAGPVTAQWQIMTLSPGGYNVNNILPSIHGGQVAWEQVRWDYVAPEIPPPDGEPGAVWTPVGSDILFWDGEQTHIVATGGFNMAPSLYNGKIAYIHNTDDAQYNSSQGKWDTPLGGD